MNKSIQQTIGVVFLLITICAFQTNASGQQKNNPSIEIEKQKIEIYARGTSYCPKGDKYTAAGQTGSLIPIQTVLSLGLHCVAVDPKVIPYGSLIIGIDKQGKPIKGIAVDTGSAVKKRTAAKLLASKMGYTKDSKEYNALVLDFYSLNGDITKHWDTFTVIPYKGKCFKFNMSISEKIAHMKSMKSMSEKTNLHLAKN